MKSIKKIFATLLLCVVALFASIQLTSSFASSNDATEAQIFCQVETSCISEEPTSSDEGSYNSPDGSIPVPGDDRDIHTVD